MKPQKKDCSNEQNDATLVAWVLAGERDAFDTLFQRHAPSVQRFCTMLLGTTVEAQDITQEAALQAFLGLSHLREPARFAAWFRAIAANLARSALRRRSEHSLEQMGEETMRDLLWINPSSTMEEYLLAREIQETIALALQDLSPAHREAVIGFYLHGYRYQELAEHLGIPLSTLKWRLFDNQLRVGSTFPLNGTMFTLIGLYTTSNPLGDSSAVIPMAMMEKVFQTKGVDSVTATAASYEQVETVAAHLRRVLGKQFDVVTQTAQYSNVFSALRVAQQSIQVALVVSFLIAAAVIVFAVLMLVRERTAEIAILKTIGASHWQVLRQFWTEILALCSTAAVLAVLLLVTLGPILAQKFDIDASSLGAASSSSSPGAFFMGTVGGPTTTTASNPLSNVHLAAATLNIQTLLIIVGVGMGLALLTSLIPTWSVSHIKPAVVLRRS